MDQRLSVYCLFSELFPEFSNDKDRPESGGEQPRRIRSTQIDGIRACPALPCVLPSLIHALDKWRTGPK